jgi:fido (protein-threonine AMPylation protein)
MADGFGKYDVYAVAGSIYCYADTNILKNRFGIRNQEQLKQIEADITAIRQNDLLTHPITGRFTPSHLCRIHRYLFSDVYSFAGHYRKEDIMKGTTRFLTHGEISGKIECLTGKTETGVVFARTIPHSGRLAKCLLFCGTQLYSSVSRRKRTFHKRVYAAVICAVWI